MLWLLQCPGMLHLHCQEAAQEVRSLLLFAFGKQLNDRNREVLEIR